MRKVIVWILLLSLLAPVSMAAAMPIQCDYAYQTGKLQDWLFCGLVLIANALIDDSGDGVPEGWTG